MSRPGPSVADEAEERARRHEDRRHQEEDGQALEEDGDDQAAEALPEDGELELGAPLQRDEGQREGVDRRQIVDGVLVDQPEDVGPGDDAGQEVPRDVREADHLHQLAGEGPGDEEEPGRGHQRAAPAPVGHDPLGPVEEGEEQHQHHGLHDARDPGGLGSGGGGASRGIGPPAAGSTGGGASGVEAGGSATSPARRRQARRQAGPTISPTMVASDAAASTVPPTGPGKRRAKVRPRVIESAPAELHPSPSQGPAGRARGDRRITTRPTSSLAARRASTAATRTQGSHRDAAIGRPPGSTAGSAIPGPPGSTHGAGEEERREHHGPLGGRDHGDDVGAVRGRGRRGRSPSRTWRRRRRGRGGRWCRW